MKAHLPKWVLAGAALAAPALLVAVALVFSSSTRTALAANSITSPDTAGTVGLYTSLALDASGNPVVSYSFNTVNRDLRVMHCNDPNCAGGGESIASPDTDGDVGCDTSLALDGSGFPVVSYRNCSNGDLKVLHCGNVDCTAGNTIHTVDSPSTVFGGTSLALDSSGYPVVSSMGSASNDLRVVHCNDPNCADGDESITSPDTVGVVGGVSSLALDDSGFPVISYAGGSGELKVLHCDDSDCAGDESTHITSPDIGLGLGAIAGYSTSLALDGSGNPVVGYYDSTNDDLKVMHCNDANCAGGDESIASPDTEGDVGRFSSVAMDGAWKPVVSYFDGSNYDIKVLHCNDANCAGGDESLTSPDTAGDVGRYGSLALDASGYPVVSYFDNTNYDLKVLHCDGPNCTPLAPTVTPTATSTPTATPTPTITPTPTTTVTPTPAPGVEALLLLRQESLVPPDIRIEDGIPRFVGVRVPVPEGLPDDPVVRALDYLERYRELYRLDDPRSQLYLKRMGTEEHGEHVFFGQQQDGIPVYAAELAVHLEGDEVVGTGGNHLPEIPSFPPAALDAAQAEGVALQHLSASAQQLERVGEVSLMYYNEGLTSGQPDETHLAWRVMVTGLRISDGAGLRWVNFVDAHSGEVLYSLDDQQQHPPDEKIKVTSVKNTTSDSCWWFRKADDWCASFEAPDKNTASGDLTHCNPDMTPIMANAHTTYHYFFGHFGLEGWDGVGKEVDTIIYWLAPSGTAAAYQPTCDHIKFAAGQTSLDIVAHEFTHGVTEKFGHTLDYKWQSGALNESYSDVFGALVANHDNPNPVTSWPGVNHSYPWPDHMNQYQQWPESNDHGGVHYYDAIPNKVAKLIAEGGTHNGLVIGGIGRDRMTPLYFHVLAWHLPSNSDFEDAKDVTITVAKEMEHWDQDPFTYWEVCQVINAFASVGLGDADVDCDGILDSEDPDSDNDAVPDDEDNCDFVKNPQQTNTDGDGWGDACDPDDDNDGILDDGDGSGVEGDNRCQGGNKTNCDDNCHSVANPNQADTDGDRWGEVCEDMDLDQVVAALDNCPETKNKSQDDNDNDGIPGFRPPPGATWGGDACDADDDKDQVLDNVDNCDYTPNPNQEDTDQGGGDGVGDACDNCPITPDANQLDCDGDAIPGTQPPPGATWGGNPCDADDDNDGTLDDEDTCRCVAAEPNTIMVGGMDLNELYRAQFGWAPAECDPEAAPQDPFEHLSLGQLIFDYVTEPLVIPLPPCWDKEGLGGEFYSCPDWLLEDHLTTVSLSLPFEMQVRIVDDRGTVLDSSDPQLEPGLDKTLSFSPSADFSYRPPLLGGGGSLGEVAALQSGEGDAYQGSQYFLEIYPSEEVVPEQEYPVALRIFVDTDGDGIADDVDNCPATGNPDQADSDLDGIGDVCDNCDPTDSDGDGIGNACDNCASSWNRGQADADLDGLGDSCDNCPGKDDPDQTDTDGDGSGDLCDNCAAVLNPLQEDAEGDDLGDACDPNDDNDGCSDIEEQVGAPAPKPGSTGAYNPTAWWDFYDVPIPANNDPTPNGSPNGSVNLQDVVGVLKYVGTSGNGPSNGRVDYDSDKDGDTVKDGRDYDRSPGPLPNPPYDAGPPSGAVNLQDVVAVLKQVGLDCSGPP